MPAKQDLTGQIFGRLTVIKYSHSNSNSVSFYLCLCKCGNEKIISGINLKRTTKSTKSCGCLHIEQVKNLRSENPELLSPKSIWRSNYADGCSFEKFLKLSQLPCFYCGIIKSNKYNLHVTQLKTGHVSKEWFEQCWFEYNGLDRLDPLKNHSEDNIVPCCVTCNIAKSNMTTEEFKIWLKRIYKNFIIEMEN